jgi:glycoside/pentoside/hexuronide:cation symporter, GPH family
VQSAFTLNGIAMLLTIVPGFFHLVMGLLMYRYFITDKYYNEKIRGLVVHEDTAGTQEQPEQDLSLAKPLRNPS